MLPLSGKPAAVLAYLAAMGPTPRDDDTAQSLHG